MAHTINIDIDQVLVLIRLAIIAGRAEAAIPLIDGVRKSLAEEKMGHMVNIDDCAVSFVDVAGVAKEGESDGSQENQA